MEIRGRAGGGRSADSGGGRPVVARRARAVRVRRSIRADGAAMRRYATGGMGFQSGSR